MLLKGQEETLIATLTPKDATDEIVWSVEDTGKSIVSVSQSGKVTALEGGTATIIATVGKVSATCSVTVKEGRDITIKPGEGTGNGSEEDKGNGFIDGEDVTVYVNRVVTMNLEMPEGITETPTLTWSLAQGGEQYVKLIPSSNTLSATFTGLSIGETSYTVSLNGQELLSGKVTVVPIKVSGIELNRTALELRATETFTLVATITPANATDKTVTWTSSNPQTVSVDADGNVLALAIGNAVITCSANDGSGVTAECRVTVTTTATQSITIKAEGSTSLKATETVQLTATVLPETATDKSVRWQSARPEIASVDSRGLVTAVAVGTVEITATNSGGQSASITITVIPTPVSRITLNRNTASLKATESLTLVASIEPETATDKSVSWTSSNPEVAGVDAQGNVTALLEGQASITCTALDGSGVSASCIVNVVDTDVETVTVSAEGPTTLKVSETVQLTATVLPETSTDKSVVWSSGDEAVASVDADGLVTALSEGSAIITATTANGLSDSMTITVIPTPATSISITVLGSTSLEVNQSVQLTAEVLPADATDKSVVWSSSNTAVATVTETGLVTALSPGESVITATNSAGQYDRVTVTVYSAEISGIGLDSIYDDNFDVVDGDIDGEIIGVYTVKGQYLGTQYHKLAPGIYIVRTPIACYKVFKKL